MATDGMAASMPTFRSLVTNFTDFFTATVHTIIYVRHIYPQTSFMSARKYNFAVRQSRHPKVCEWINDAVSAVEAELLKGSVDQVVVAIHDKDSRILEKFIFNVSRFPVIDFDDVDVPIEPGNPNGENAAILPLVDMEEQFRATMSRLSSCSSTLKPLPKGCSFSIVIELKGDGHAPLEHPQPWIPVQPQTEKLRSNPHERMSNIPVRSVSAGEMVFEIWIEQSKDVPPRE